MEVKAYSHSKGGLVPIQEYRCRGFLHNHRNQPRKNSEGSCTVPLEYEAWFFSHLLRKGRQTAELLSGKQLEPGH